MGFPLPRGYFRDVNLSEERRQQLIDVVRYRVQTMLEDEQRYVARKNDNQLLLDPNEWVSAARIKEQQKELQIYRRRRRGRSFHELAMKEDFLEAQEAVIGKNPSMVAIGTVDGTIENMMYGMSATSQADLITGFSYNNPPRDCALLGHLEHATPEDPFYSADFIWALPKLPSAAKQVDTCYLKATGVETDASGKRYGYLVLHSVDLSECPPFDKRYKVTRAKMFFACLFREITSETMSVVVRGIFNLQNAGVKFMLRQTTASFIGGMFNGVGVGESKKLTLLARRSQDRLHELAQTPAPTQCSMCVKRSGRFPGSSFLPWHVVLDQCRVCGFTICSKCAKDVKTGSSRKRLFLGAAQPCSEYTCCRVCVREAKQMTVRPAEAQFVIVADYYRARRSLLHTELHSSSSSNGSNGSGTVVMLSPSTATFSLDTIPRNRGRNDILKTNTSAGMATNSIADMDDGRFSDMSELDSAKFDSDSEDDPDFIDLDTDYQPEPSPGVSDDSEFVAWKTDDRIDFDDFTPSTNHRQRSRRANYSAASTREEHDAYMFNRMYKATCSAEMAYATTLTNLEAMRDEELKRTLD
ncbi:hypothetical protein PHYBOEH_005208 [Phytophthora boehmeriae]|uniref:FYVE-type domain-containing protein n=1 Tax=Phytophthora boehmeriae TaxID=109152 RepID=A0A8T1WQ16_9STRA|nr:hypothetical protein PHYBOEH_005208 [Phytophthora boehmeriae]